MQLSVLVLLVATPTVLCLTRWQARQFTHKSYTCATTSTDNDPYLTQEYDKTTKETTITTNHLPNHLWECVVNMHS